MKATGDFHHLIASPRSMQSHALFQHAAPFDAAVDMLYPYPAGRELSVLGFLFSRQLATTRLPVWSAHRHPIQSESEKP
jgi:hypothetical protein